MTVDRMRNLVKKNFSDAARFYDNHASFQRIAGTEFLDFIREYDKSADTAKNILELGSGTGMLSLGLKSFYRNARFTITDLSESMLEQARGKISDDAKTVFKTYDFNSAYSGTEKFERLFSGMALQWSDSLENSLLNIKKIMSHDAQFYFSLPLAGTFRWLHDVFQEENQPYPGLPLYSETRFHNLLEKLFGGHYILQKMSWKETYETPLEFLRILQITGTDSASGNVISPALMRRILRRHPGRMTANYEYVFAVCFNTEILY